MLTINTAINPIQTKPFANKPNVAVKTLHAAQNNVGLLIPKVVNLSSKYNINFKGHNSTDLETFSADFEKKIEKMVTPDNIR